MTFVCIIIRIYFSHSHLSVAVAMLNCMYVKALQLCSFFSFLEAKSFEYHYCSHYEIHCKKSMSGVKPTCDLDQTYFKYGWFFTFFLNNN